MKTVYTFLSLIFLLTTLTLKAQDCYIVMKIKGTIVLESTGQILQKDDQICGNDKVIFKTPDAAALVHSSTKGRYTLKSNKSRVGELEGVISSVVSSALSKKTANLDTKSLDLPVKNEFDVVYCIIDEYELALEEGENPVNEENYFMLSFMHNNKPLEIKLKSSGNTVYFNKEDIFTQMVSDGNFYLIEVAVLYYINSENKDNPKPIDAFDLVFPDEKNLADELSNFKVLLRNSGRSEEAINEDLIAYITNAYGIVNNANFIEWANKNVK